MNNASSQNNLGFLILPPVGRLIGQAMYLKFEGID
jgi:hypothetical protein